MAPTSNKKKAADRYDRYRLAHREENRRQNKAGRTVSGENTHGYLSRLPYRRGLGWIPKGASVGKTAGYVRKSREKTRTKKYGN